MRKVGRNGARMRKVGRTGVRRSDVPCFGGIEVAQAQLAIALRPSGDRWAVAKDARGGRRSGTGCRPSTPP
jgi:hypothetical protein